MKNREKNETLKKNFYMKREEKKQVHVLFNVLQYEQQIQCIYINVFM